MTRRNDPDIFPRLRLSALQLKAAAIGHENDEIERITVHAYKNEAQPQAQYALLATVKTLVDDTVFQFLLEEVTSIIDTDIYRVENYPLVPGQDIEKEWFAFPILHGEGLPNGTVDDSYWQLYPPQDSGDAEKIKSLFPTPGRWEDVTIRFVDGHTVAITVEGTDIRNAKCNFAELGLKDGRTGNPTVQWRLLKALADNRGSISWDNSAADPKIKKQVSLLRATLTLLFGIQTDSPFGNYRQEQAYRARFNILPEA